MSEDWLGRWRDGRTGWHEADGNAMLQTHWPELHDGSRVLVPLCGKTRDLAWLAEQGCEVTGVELSPLAVAAFFSEQGLEFTRRPSAGFSVWQARELSITLFCGDYFRFDTSLAGAPFDALYDRGALVALNAAARPGYAAHTTTLLDPAADLLVVTLEYDQSQAAGPPFAVLPAEVTGYWPRLKRVAERDDLAGSPPKFRDAGLRRFVEVAWQASRGG